MLVVSTLGHVDHGKSTLVRALTGREPDRLAEERRRGMTIELGHVWADLGPPHAPVTVAFVDVPGHQRLVGTALAGLGPAPAVLLVVASDDGWSAQTTEHVDAAVALGITRGVVAVTRADLADPAAVAADVARRLAGTGLARAAVVPCSAVTGEGLQELGAALAALEAPAAPDGGRHGVDGSPGDAAGPDLWVDRVFSAPGSGTVLTGTLTHGRLRTGSPVVLQGRGGSRGATVRGLQSLGTPLPEQRAVARVAVNLRGVPRELVHRGDRLLAEGLPDPVTEADVLVSLLPGRDLPARGSTEVQLHVGTAVRPVRVRALGVGVARLGWQQPLPLRPGDRGLLREPGAGAVLAGVRVLQPAPPPLTRRGQALLRARELTDPGSVVRSGAVLADRDDWQRWSSRLRSLVGSGGPVRVDRAARAVGAPVTVLPALAEDAGLVLTGDRVRGEDPVRAGLDRLLARLDADPLDAPDGPGLAAYGVPGRALHEAAVQGRLLLLDGVVLGAGAPDRARAALAAVSQPFTAGQARAALGTSRRVALPLLEHLDRLGVTERLDATHRRIVPAQEAAGDSWATSSTRPPSGPGRKPTRRK